MPSSSPLPEESATPQVPGPAAWGTCRLETLGSPLRRGTAPDLQELPNRMTWEKKQKGAPETHVGSPRHLPEAVPRAGHTAAVSTCLPLVSVIVPIFSAEPQASGPGHIPGPVTHEPAPQGNKRRAASRARRPLSQGRSLPSAPNWLPFPAARRWAPGEPSIGSLTEAGPVAGPVTHTLERRLKSSVFLTPN